MNVEQKTWGCQGVSVLTADTLRAVELVLTDSLSICFIGPGRKPVDLGGYKRIKEHDEKFLFQ